MRSAFRETNYEIHVSEEGRWTIDSVVQRKKEAIDHAKFLLGAKKAQAVRVVQETEGRKPETIFEQARPDNKAAINACAVETAPLCSRVEDFYAHPARRTAGHVFRRYLEHTGLSVIEILHDTHKLADMVRGDDTLMVQAIHRVAAAQDRVAEAEGGDRVEFLWQAFEQLRERAREAPPPDPLVEILDEKGIDALLQAEQDPVRIGAGFAAYLSRSKDSLGKAGLVLILLERGTGDEGRVLLDELLSEILDGPEPIKDLLAGQADLGSAVANLVRLATGKFEPRRGDEETIPARLSAACAKNDLPETCAVLLGRAAATLGGIKALSRENPEGDRRLFKIVFELLRAPGGLWGGARMAEAVTQRARVLFGRDGEDLSLEEGVKHVCDSLLSRAQKLGYLLDLTGTRAWEQNRGFVLEFLLQELRGLDTASDLLPDGVGAGALGAVIADLQPRFAASALPPEAGKLFTDRISRLSGAVGVTADLGSPKAAPPKKAEKGLPRRKVAAGEYLFRQGDAGEEAFILMSGAAEIRLQTTDRGEIFVDDVERGEIIGEMALVDDQPRMASARVTEDSEFMVIPREAFKAKLDRALDSDHVVRQLVETFVTRLRRRPVLGGPVGG